MSQQLKECNTFNTLIHIKYLAGPDLLLEILSPYTGAVKYSFHILFGYWDYTQM
jgi:hypothetical protein